MPTIDEITNLQAMIAELEKADNDYRKVRDNGLGFVIVHPMAVHPMAALTGSTGPEPANTAMPSHENKKRRYK